MSTSKTDSTLIYKIVPKDLWQEAVDGGLWAGAPIDVQDGFIHFSTAEQLAETARRHFAGQDDLLVVGVRTEDLGIALVFEPSRGGDLFPHLYGSLPMDAVAFSRDMPLGPDGNHVLPSLTA